MDKEVTSPPRKAKKSKRRNSDETEYKTFWDVKLFPLDQLIREVTIILDGRKPANLQRHPDETPPTYTYVNLLQLYEHVQKAKKRMQ